MIDILGGKRDKGQSKKSLNKVIREDLKLVGLMEDLTQDRRLWRDEIKIVDRRESSP